MNRNYDAIVIGAGQAGPFLAARFAGAGKSVAIIERHLFGGTCVNAGCTPTKTLIASARIAYDARRAHDYGIELPAGGIAVNMREVHARKNRVVDASRTGLENWLGGMPTCSIYKGHARFESATSVSVDGEVLTSGQIFINVGGRPRKPVLLRRHRLRHSQHLGFELAQHDIQRLGWRHGLARLRGGVGVLVISHLP